MHTFLRQAAAVIAGLVFAFSARADWGIFQTYAFLDAGDGMIGYAGNSNADGVPSFAGTSFTFVEGQSSFTLEGGEMKTWKNGGSNVCGGNLFYRVYSAADVPGDFASIALGYQSELANAGDQKWGAYDQHIDLLSGLAPGDYTLEVFWNYTGGQFGGCADTRYESNDGNNYSLSFIIEAPVPCVNSFTMDYLGVTYDLAEAGGRCWFAENLQATTFNNGTEIPQAITGLSWQYPGANPYRLPPGSSTGWVSEFGWLYNGGAASNGGICPSGWRVPSVAQWQALIDEFGGNEVAGGAFKETGNVTDQTGTWTAPNTGATNESGMTLRGAGLAYPHDFEHGFRSYGLFWTSDYAVTDPTFAVQEKYVIALRYDAPTALVEQYTIPHGFSIRCLQRVSGCKDNTACNYDASVDDNDPSQCTYPSLVAYADADGDGAGDPASTMTYCTDVPEGFVLVAGDGCPDDAGKTDPGTCGCGSADADTDEDGVLDCNEVAGCSDASACNYNADATDDGTCYWLPAAPVEWEGLAVTALQPSLDATAPEGAADVLWVAPSGAHQNGPSATLDEVGNWTVSWASNAGNESPSCTASVTITVERMGCTDAAACNYDAAATTAGVNCLFATAPCDSCSGANDGTGFVVDGDTNANGTCDDSEVSGCMNDAACNYNAAATVSDDSCLFATGCDTCGPAGSVIDGDADNDGVCDGDEIAGCTDAVACNYDTTATDADDSCVYPAGCQLCSGATDGTGTVLSGDADGDGVCDDDEVLACTDPEACNFNSDPTVDTDNSLCDFTGDCNGDCEGTATTTSTGCCIGGNTGYDVYNCSPQGMLCDYDVQVGSTASAPLGGFTFQAGMTGALSRIRMITLGGSGERAEVRNRDTGELLGQGIPDSEAYSGSYEWRSFTFSDLALEEGTWYKVTLTGGYYQWIGQNASNTYPGGTKYGMNASTSGYATFKTIVCAPVPGCMDASACNYDATANLSATCLYADDPCEVCNAQGGVDVLDEDGDGVCDADEIPGCTHDAACNYDLDATDDDGSCILLVACEECADGAAVLIDADGDGVCDLDDLCTDLEACNYAHPANEACLYAAGPCEICTVLGGVDNFDADGDGICDADEIPGCQDDTACNFDASATDSDNSCVYATATCEVCLNGSAVLQDADSDGVCNGDEISGCQDEAACNYNGSATDSDNSCVYATANCEACLNGAVVNQDADGDGVCDADEIPGCQDDAACNYNASATDNDNSCVYASANCEVCLNGSAVVEDADNDGVCDANEVAGCQDNTACNYDPAATDSDTSCIYATGNCEVCQNGAAVVQDADNDGVCDADELPGCQDAAACNYNSTATDSDNSCTYATANCAVCLNGAPVIQDADNDGVCDGDEIAGCQDDAACNYNAAATDSDGTCVYATANCAVCENGDVVVQDADNDGVCDANEVAGCQDNTACNYDPAATDSDTSCIYATGNCEVCQNGAAVVQDADNDGVCDGDEVAGCQDNTACNYEANATDSDNSCIYATGTCEVCEDGQAVVQDADNDGVCDADEIAGCMDATACNYDASATDDQGCNYASVTWYVDADGDGTGFAGNPLVACTQPAGYVLTSGDNCPNDPNKLTPGTCGCGEVDVDADGDGLCDDVDGCADPTACNYAAPLATECFTTNSCGNCGPETTVTCGLQGACNYDPTGDCFDADLCDFDSCAGCMNNNACNYDATASISAPLTCTFPAFAWVDCAGACENDLDQNGVCDEVEIAGCMDSAAINYNPNATTDNGSCFIELVGCIIPVALNYDDNATVQGVPLADYCTFPPATGGVPGPATASAPGPGCTEPSACNYDPAATSDNGSCEYTSCLGCDQPSACNFDPTVLYNDGSCDWTSCAGCTNPAACDYDDQATISQPCDFSSCLGCTNVSASNYDATASIDDGSCILPGCTNPAACNFDPLATSNDGSCTYAVAYYACSGACLNDSDGDGVCDEFEVGGCTNASACNYDASATEDDGSCVVATTWYEDVDGDGFGDSASSQTSCTQPPGYVANATDNCPAHAAKQDPGTCGCDTADTDADSDGIADCNDDCTDTSACNYDANPTAACVFVTPGYDCDGVCLDLNTNGTCDLDEGEYAGCQDATACNYDPVASLPDPASCTYLNLVGIAVDAASQASAADGLVVPSYTGGTGTVNLLDATSGAVLPASTWGFMPAGRYRFRMQDAASCLSVETRSVVIPYAGCD